MSFTGVGDDVTKFNGSGKMKMREAKLFSIPIFGSLSGVMDKIILSKGTFEQKATELSAHFLIKNGLMSTDSFHTRTGSFHFDGTGWIDLAKQEIDLTIETKGRGLIEILNLPLKPLYGIFRYRGKGPLSNPEWKIAPFRRGDTER